MTWQEIADYVAEVYKKEGGLPNYNFFRTLGNAALDAMSEVGGYEVSWTPTPVGNIVTIPVDCITVNRVEWGDATTLVKRVSVKYLDYNDPGWRISTGTVPEFYCIEGGAILLDRAPTAFTEGQLVLRGKAYLPNFPEGDSPTAVNPLDYVSRKFQILPAYYILWNLPVDTVQIEYAPGKLRLALHPTGVERREFYVQKWQAELVAYSARVFEGEFEDYTND